MSEEWLKSSLTKCQGLLLSSDIQGSKTSNIDKTQAKLLFLRKGTRSTKVVWVFHRLWRWTITEFLMSKVVTNLLLKMSFKKFTSHPIKFWESKQVLWELTVTLSQSQSREWSRWLTAPKVNMHTTTVISKTTQLVTTRFRQTNFWTHWKTEHMLTTTYSIIQ